MSSDFDDLQPQLILDAIEAAGYSTTGEYSQLNSYENRVFDIRLEEDRRFSTPTELNEPRVIAKFYRPRRWTPAAIKDEHDFMLDLQQEGIPAVAPLELRNGQTLLTYENYTFALFPRVLGRNPQEFKKGELKQVGRTLARIHNVGARHWAEHRPSLTAETYGWKVLPKLERFVYPELWNRYHEAAEILLEAVEQNLNPDTFIRIHGDCHKGNLLHSGDEFFMVDFDDFCNGPVAQDFWMLLSGSIDKSEAQAEQNEICSGYEELRELPDEWQLFEPLRALRIIHYAAWIANRWNDPFFKRIFPEFLTYNYWLEELRQLEEIISELE
jgi:Ser/Thr protein kinase RdoA (MazF antagonist)